MTTKEEVEALQRVIKVAQEQIEAIQKECKHEHIHQGRWYCDGTVWGIAMGFHDAILCGDCGGLVKLKDARLSEDLPQDVVEAIGEEQERLEKDYEEFQKEQL